MPQGPAARLGDAVVHPTPPILTGGPPAVTVLIGGQPAWKGIPLAAAPGIMATSTSTQATLQTLETTALAAEAAAVAAAGTPGAPAAVATATAARLAAETAKASSLAANSASIAAAAAGGSSTHACALPWPIPPHGPGVVIDGSATVMIENCPACRMGDTIIEAIGPPNKITMGCPTVIIGDSGGGGGGGGAVAAGVAGAAGGAAPKGAEAGAVPKGCEYLNKPYTVEAPVKEFDRIRSGAKLGPPTEGKHTFPGDTAPSDAIIQDVEVKGRTVKLVLPKSGAPAGKHLPTADQIAKALGAVPGDQLDSIKEVVVSPNQNPSDAYWAKEYKIPDFSSAATGGPGGVTFYPKKSPWDQAFVDSTSIHEGGHAYSLALWKDPEKKKAWEAAIKKDGRSPSTYADSSTGEDFSESLVMYSLSKGTECEAAAKARYPARYEALDALFKK